MRPVTLLLLVASLGLASCETLSASLPARPCPPDVKAGSSGPEPRVPDAAGFPAPATEDERVATASYLTWLAEFSAWGREGNRRADKSATWCREIEQ